MSTLTKTVLFLVSQGVIGRHAAEHYARSSDAKVFGVVNPQLPPGLLPFPYLLFGFGSSHVDIVNFAFADGSARPVGKSISLPILQALATRDGGERVSDDF